MLTTLAVGNYRSLLNLTLPLTGLNLISVANGCGKSNLYRALRLLALSAQGELRLSGFAIPSTNLPLAMARLGLPAS
ncbi:hypothetical protein [Balneatrix alpica]|uniref:hypothetical protein n=1 Tax=Balneatrix alpica TaxID=75684 RepID=UPI0027393DC1|nr:hypothetical protein [Balneatrix alpica]